MTTTTPKTKKKPVIKADENKEIIPAKSEMLKSASEELGVVLQEAAHNNEQIVVQVVEETKVSIKKRKPPKAKVIRDSFSFPEHDYLKISVIKKTCLAEGIHVKKGEILRAGLRFLSGLSIDQLKLAIEQVDRVKTGRPKA